MSQNKWMKSLLFALLPLHYQLSVPPHAGCQPQDKSAPQISVPEKEFDVGNINEGVETRHVFKISNTGGQTLRITKTHASCGCTVPTIKKNIIEPGETVDMEVLMDTSMKQGSVSKPIEIHSNDPINPIVKVHLKAKVKSPHADLGRADERSAKIFTGRCAACHVTKGIGKVGGELFFADCAMCHGFSARGVPGVAPALVPFDYHNQIFADGMKKIISEGSKTHRSMPGFLKSAGGPLSEKEILSLVEFLKQKSDAESRNKAGE